MNITYKNIGLRRAKVEDAKGIYEITNDDDVMEFYGVSGAYYKSRDEALGEIEWFNSLFNDGAGRWVIELIDSGEYIGDIGFSDFDKDHKRAEIGYKLKKEYWGRGIISNLIGQLVPYIINTLGYNRIEAIVDVRNPGSKAVLIKNGFISEGILREYEFERGNFVDLEMLSILKRDL